MADEVQAAKLARDVARVVIDTGQRPKRADLQALSEGCDMLVIPTVPATLDTEGLVLTLQELNAIGTAKYKVLITKVPLPQRLKPRSCERSWRLKASRCSAPTFRA